MTCEHRYIRFVDPDAPPRAWCSGCGIEMIETEDRKFHPKPAGPSSWPAPAPVDKAESIGRLCELLGEVWEHFDPDAHEANDCFCSKAIWDKPAHFRSSGQALAFVETVVRAALKGGSDV